ncbi:MAG: hypothetical protein GF330_14085 [Candidatus Eisenbacteria bacterium]|nr:hypothetical protein [Candidatus Eisenbacteria bacterium]
MLTAGILLGGVLLAGGAPAAVEAPQRPPEILSWRHQVLSHERYEELAERWAAFTEAHPRDPAAWVHWGHALRYAGEDEAANQKYTRAFEIDSTEIVALEAYASMQATRIGPDQPEELARTHTRLLRAVAEHPNYARSYYALFITSLMLGDVRQAEECLRRMVTTGDMPRPLFDHGYNMIAGAPLEAIIFTNGDNDTYPPLAVQAVTGVRPDVSIVNLSLLNTKWYIRYLRERGLPIALRDAEIAGLKHAKDNLIGAQMQRHIFDQLARSGWPRPLFYAATVYEANRILPVRLVIEGLGLRVVPTEDEAGKDLQDDFVRTRRLFDTVYRIDGFTDPLVNWERESALWVLGSNYATLLERLGMALLAGSPAEAAPYLYRAVALLSFHNRLQRASVILDRWAEVDPESPLLAEARRLPARRVQRD